MGPGFGSGVNDLYIPNNCFSNKSTSCFSNSYQFDNNKMYNGKIDFYIQEYEVYLVRFKN